MALEKTFELEASLRHELGKGASRRLRRQEKVPGIVYGGGKAPVSLTFEHKKISKSLEQEAFYSHILTLKIDDGAELVILKDLQRHPFKPRITHVDFQRVKADEKLHMHVPLHFIGADKAPGVKAGGIVSHIMTDAEIACLPTNLPEYLEVDISGMQLNQILHLSDITLPTGVELVALMHHNDQPVASIHLPRAEEEPSAAASEAPAASEVPAIAQKGEDESKKKE